MSIKANPETILKALLRIIISPPLPGGLCLAAGISFRRQRAECKDNVVDLRRLHNWKNYQ
jgi:hypothetical protein